MLITEQQMSDTTYLKMLCGFCHQRSLTGRVFAKGSPVLG